MEARVEQATGSHSVSERVLQKCHFELQKELDVPILLPYLAKYRLITADVHEELTLQATSATKVDKLVAELPRSGEHFLERFIKCLQESEKDVSGTHHEQIADALEKELRRRNGSGLKQICCNTWCCYTAILLVTMVSLLLIMLTQGLLMHPEYVYKNGTARTAQGPFMHPKYVYKNSTAELLFDHMPYYAKVALVSSGCSPQGQLYIIRNRDCSKLPYVTTRYVSFWNPVDHVYMRPGSTINFTVSPAATGQVWILPDYIYNEYSNNYTDFNCHLPPSGAYCFEASKYLNTWYLHSITQPAFYYIRLQPPSFNVTPNKLNYNQSYDRVLFNVDAIPPSATVTKYTLSSEFTPVYFRKPFSCQKTCVLLNIPSDSFCVTPIVVQVSNFARQEDSLIYLPLAILLICLAVLFMFVYFHRK